MAGCDTKFVATGQTGMLIEGDGFAVDSVVSDFVGGRPSARFWRPRTTRDGVEGQGSLANPRYSGVTMGLLHGCLPGRPGACYEAGRTGIVGLEPMLLPPLEQVAQAFLSAANLHHPCRFIGVAINGRLLSDEPPARKGVGAETLNCRLGTWCARASTALSARR
ncbi:MAG: hypothetical protein CM1200mP29_17210 [Verrucomicrobiota bacterium]|nr:MAG: hypothetical protein CM1200mP29_17210 [Verrucomicrobiota bacterium]